MLNIKQTRVIRFASVKILMAFIAFFPRIATLATDYIQIIILILRYTHVAIEC